MCEDSFHSRAAECEVGFGDLAAQPSTELSTCHDNSAGRGRFHDQSCCLAEGRRTKAVTGSIRFRSRWVMVIFPEKKANEKTKVEKR